MFVKKIVSIITLTLATQVMAQPSSYSIRFICPSTTGQVNVLTNFGTFVGGDGGSIIDGQDYILPAFFRSAITPESHIPNDLSLGGYYNSGTSYTSSLGMVTCYYTSAQSFDPIKVSYTMFNGTGGTVTSRTENGISIYLARGLKS